MNKDKEEEEVLKNCSFGTQAVKGTKVEYPVPSLAIPIFATSTYVLDSASHGAKLTNRDEIPEGTSKWLYTRWDNPTVDAAERLITRLEGGKRTYLYGSGMGAISTLFFSLVKAGQHVIVQLPAYAGTQEVVHLLQRNYNVEATFIPVSPDFIDKVRAAIKDNTVLLYGETPSNPTMDILDIESFAALGREKKIITAVDSTFASPVNQLPLSYGIDVVVHSCTKYYGGHSDLTAGSLTTTSDEIADAFWKTRKLFGACLSPFEAQLLVRGIKTMELRVKKQNENAFEIANWLQKHPKIKHVFYPGLESHPGHAIAAKQMKGFGGMISFEVIGGEEGGRTLIENVRVINLAVSLGGIESLIEHAASMTHAMIDPVVRRESGISDGLIRFSVGIEDVSDLIADLDHALSLINLSN